MGDKARVARCRVAAVGVAVASKVKNKKFILIVR